MMRPPSREDVVMAQPHLVLLKSKMRQRRAPAAYHQQPRSAAGGDDHHRGRFERVAAVGAGNAARPNPLQTSPRAGGGSVGMTWDPPAAVHDDRSQQPMPMHSPTTTGALGRTREAGYPAPPAQPSPQHRGGGPAAAMGGLGPPNAFGPGAFPPGAFPAGGMPMEEEDDGPLVPCPECGRNFKEARLEKHVKVCKKVFQQKRKAFDSAANRLGELENADALIANAKKLEKDRDKVEKAPAKESKKGEAVPEWRKKSLAFRQAILAAKAAEGDADAQAKAAEIGKQLADMGGAESSNSLKCPHCGRTFNKEAGERHIAICVKTFGSKNIGGRLMKGGGRTGQAPAPTSTRTASNGPASRKPPQPRGHY
mmetsp:Transcript_38563/g.110747  ORF Transcript_38563/g.110747 Transcript_38563/m.110747 type:complete len:367 (-) Transcript_38563:191-1291(-)